MTIAVETEIQSPVTVKLAITSDGPDKVAVYGNETRLGTWSASITVMSSRTMLNITCYDSHGLIFGDIQDVQFSFFLPYLSHTSFISSSGSRLLEFVKS